MGRREEKRTVMVAGMLCVIYLTHCNHLAGGAVSSAARPRPRRCPLTRPPGQPQP